jgi:CheY-like chemotaxis protein
MRMLVIDDIEAKRKLRAWILEDEGHEVAEAIRYFSCTG